MLMHSPDGLTALGDEPFAIAFTGHVHGGQFVLPGGKSLISSKGPLSQRYLYGGVFELGAPGRAHSARESRHRPGLVADALPRGPGSARVHVSFRARIGSSVIRA